MIGQCLGADPAHRSRRVPREVVAHNLFNLLSCRSDIRRLATRRQESSRRKPGRFGMSAYEVPPLRSPATPVRCDQGLSPRPSTRGACSFLGPPSVRSRPILLPHASAASNLRTAGSNDPLPRDTFRKHRAAQPFSTPSRILCALLPGRAAFRLVRWRAAEGYEPN